MRIPLLLSFLTIGALAQGQRINEEFNTFPPTGWSVPLNQGTLLSQQTTTNSYGRTGTLAAVRANNYGVSSGNRAQLDTRTFTGTTTNDSLRFDVANAAYPGYVDSLIILTSSGSGFTRLIGWGSQATVNTTTGITTAAAQTGNFTPTSTEWTTKVLGLPAGTTQVRFEFYSGWGNQIWIDRVVVDSFNNSAMVYDSSNCAQPNLSVIGRGATNQSMLRVKISTHGASSPLSATSFTFSTTGSTNASGDIDSAKVFYTGTSSSFSPVSLFGVAAAPNGTFSVSGSQTLASGDNYFWLAYDIKPTATPNNVVDADCSLMIVGGTAYAPTVGAPAGDRTIKAPFAGNVSVGSSGTYSTLSAAINDIAAVGLSGNTLLEVGSNITEPGSIVIPQWTESGAGNYRLTIKPTAVDTIFGNVSGGTTGLIVLQGADRVSIDGRIGTASSNALTIVNTNATGTANTILVNSLGTGQGANNDTIRNLNILGANNLATSPSVAAIYSAGDNNQNLVIMNNNISRATNAIVILPVNAPSGLDSGLVIASNVIGTASPASTVSHGGISVAGAPNAKIQDNVIMNILDGSGTNSYGIQLGAYTRASSIIRNSIDSVFNSNTGGWGAYGINIGSGTVADSIVIANNMISGLGIYTWTSTSTTYNPFGIRLAGGSFHKVYFNTVNLYGSSAGNTQSNSACLLITTGTGMDVRNNIFSNTLTAGASSTSYDVYAAATGMFANVNYNDYYFGGTYGRLGYYSGSSYTTLAGGWRTATGMDANSDTLQPVFAANDDLHLAGASLGEMRLTAQPLAGFTDDFDQQNRHSVYPYKGADESIAFPLPVKYMYFTAERQHKDVSINWATASEVNSAFFVIERSSDNVNFAPVQKQQARGNSTVVSTYAFTDEGAKAHAVNDMLYYRLRQVDADGTFEYSNIAVVNFREGKATPVESYPNPFTSFTHIRFNAAQAGHAEIAVIDIHGKNVGNMNMAAAKGINTQVMNLSADLAPGVYFMKVTMSGETKVVKITKQ